MRFALIQVAVNLGLGITLFRLIGFEGIAAATSIACWLNVVMMLMALSRRGAYHPSPVTLTRLIKMLIASVAMGVFLAIASALRADYEPWLFGLKEVALAVVVCIGGAIYIGLLFGLRAITVAEIKDALKRPPKAPKAGEAAPADLL